jgi:glycosyltransferase involved in cell wall biosynthesis
MISIIIPTYNEGKYLSKLLESLKQQTFQDFEIIVSDNDSKDKTKQIAKKYGCKIVKGGIPAVARNNGAKIANGDLLFVDADVIIKANNLIETFLTEIKAEKLDCASLKITPDSNNFSAKFYYFIKNYLNKLFGYIKGNASGQFLFVKKIFFDKVGGYDGSLILGEEHDLVHRLKGKGAKFHFFMDLSVTNSARRVEKEGLIKLLVKNAYSEIIRFFGFKITKKLFDYEFGKY